jgi:hypothetical protein
MSLMINQSPQAVWEYASSRNPTAIYLHSCACSASSSIADPSVSAISNLFREGTRSIGRYHKDKGDSSYDLSVEVYSGDTMIVKSRWTIAISAFTPVDK